MKKRFNFEVLPQITFTFDGEISILGTCFAHGEKENLNLNLQLVVSDRLKQGGI